MTSKERFLTAIANGVPDRVPTLPKIYVDLAARLTGRDLVTVLSDPLEALLTLVEAGRLVQADAVRLFHLPSRKLEKSGMQVMEMNTAREPIGSVDMEGGLMTFLSDPSSFKVTDQRHVAFNHFYTAAAPFIRDLDDVGRMVVPKVEFYHEYGCAQRQAVAIQAAEEAGLAVVGDCDTATMAFLVTMRGMNNAMLDLYDQPQLAHAIMDKGVLIAAQRGMFHIDAGVRVLRINDSVGNMSVISPQHWREFVFPRLKDLCLQLHAYCPEVKLYCHICGNMLPIVDDLVATGLDCIAPLDPLGGFRPSDIRARVGNCISLMGGVDTLSFIHKNPTGIEDEGLRCIQEAGQQGGFVLGSGCVVPRATPLENLRALRIACEKHGVYEQGILQKEAKVGV